MGRGGRILRALFGAVIFWGVIWFMYVGILPNHATTLMASIRVPSAGTFKHLKLSGGESHLIRHDMDLNYVSKRRVPNGPDPIHNSMRINEADARVLTPRHFLILLGEGGWFWNSGKTVQSRQPPGRS
ncbi:hypothetical protein SADUNF_Sadunf17G0069700 [Salix dunnii]|uniref:CLAVATA3/ESR (CLE)-related protein 25 n=1 Tax=Salix dunnii TaxID=1413687 RepID=A0A835J8B3_9ROSI|nr:hypothetical protein SADUNF_Sadunf17G0069700 [Salix dunnii]